MVTTATPTQAPVAGATRRRAEDAADEPEDLDLAVSLVLADVELRLFDAAVDQAGGLTLDFQLGGDTDEPDVDAALEWTNDAGEEELCVLPRLFFAATPRPRGGFRGIAATPRVWCILRPRVRGDAAAATTPRRRRGCDDAAAASRIGARGDDTAATRIGTRGDAAAAREIGTRGDAAAATRLVRRYLNVSMDWTTHQGWHADTSIELRAADDLHFHLSSVEIGIKVDEDSTTNADFSARVDALDGVDEKFHLLTEADGWMTNGGGFWWTLLTRVNGRAVPKWGRVDAILPFLCTPADDPRRGRGVTLTRPTEFRPTCGLVPSQVDGWTEADLEMKGAVDTAPPAYEESDVAYHFCVTWEDEERFWVGGGLNGASKPLSGDASVGVRVDGAAVLKDLSVAGSLDVAGRRSDEKMLDAVGSLRYDKTLILEVTAEADLTSDGAKMDGHTPGAEGLKNHHRGRRMTIRVVAATCLRPINTVAAAPPPRRERSSKRAGTPTPPSTWTRSRRPCASPAR